MSEEDTLSRSSMCACFCLAKVDQVLTRLISRMETASQESGV
ncbi:hypothetical protein ACLK1T_24785 [Escherichia coli]